MKLKPFVRLSGMALMALEYLLKIMVAHKTGPNFLRHDDIYEQGF